MAAATHAHRLHGRSCDPAMLGGKGAALDRLVAGGFPVPPTGVVTTEAYRAVATTPEVRALLARIGAPGGPDGPVDDDEIDDAFVAAPLPTGVATAIGDLAAEVGGGGLVAVRSSATVEDLEGSSFAGQYRSLLDVDPGDRAAVARAVALVWASLWHRAPRAYRQALGVADDAAAMAVVVMSMVPARQAGVVFTVDPGGAPGAARVEAVAGLGEALVSGQATPNAWVLPREPAGADAPLPVREALQLALRVERRERIPQDVEWAWDGATTWVVQARPITVLGAEAGDGFDDAPDDDELTTAGIEEMLPGVLPPLLWELDSHLVEQAFRRVLDSLGVLGVAGDRPLLRRVRGRAALDFTVLRTMAATLPGGDPGELEAQYFGVRVTAERDSATVPGPRFLASLHHDLRVVATRQRAVLDAEIVCDAVREALDPPLGLAALSDGDLLGYRLALIDLATRGMSAELAVAAAAGGSYRRLELLLERHLGVDEARRQAQLVTSGGIEARVHPDASAALFGGATWAELGSAAAGPAGTTTGGDEERRAAVGRLLEHLTTQPAWRRHRWLTGQVIDVRRHLLVRVVDDTVSQLRRRERTKAAVMHLGGEVRRIHRELARRLVDRGILDRAEDIELLSTGELARALDGDAAPGTELARRRRYLQRCQDDGPLPVRFDGRHPDRGWDEHASAADVDGERLSGWAASPGRRSGLATVVRSSRDDLPEGRVLVAAATDASWSPLFLRAAAIVVERGGPLSHAAILARELGVPAVLNVADATRHLDGRWVTVDGDRGTVTIGRDAAGPEEEGASDEAAMA